MKIASRICFVLVAGWLCMQNAMGQEAVQPRRPVMVPRPQMPQTPQLPAARSRILNGEVKPAGQTARNRIQHLRMAADNLTLAGFEREGTELRERAVVLERELARSQATPGPDTLAVELRELRESLDQLRHEVQALRQQLREGGRAVLDSEFDAPRVPRNSHEGRIRLPDRGARMIPDEELDAAPKDRPYFDRTPAQPARAEADPDSISDPEFELVPVPVPDTPVPTPNQE